MASTETISTEATTEPTEVNTPPDSEQVQTSEQIQTEQHPTDDQSQADGQLQSDEKKQKDDSEHSGAIFQAVGVIIGKIAFNDENKSTIVIGNKEYPLFYAPKKQRAFDALKKEIEATGEHVQRLVVYPKVIHFPKKEQPHQVCFQLVGFDKGRQAEVISKELQDMEFKLCGLWQFIPVCCTPCISVFRNFTKERLDYIKQAEPAKKVKFMKASHLPLFWKDAPFPPFRFNPKATKEEQGHPVFVQIKAKFLPQRDAFAFDTLLALPEQKPPRFLKASKQDKSSVQAEKKAAQKAAYKEAGASGGKPPYKGKPKSNFKDKPKPQLKPQQ